MRSDGESETDGECESDGEYESESGDGAEMEELRLAVQSASRLSAEPPHAPARVPPAACEDEPHLRAALLATSSKSLALPATSTFERLHPAATDVRVCVTDVFASHSSYLVPCDSGEPLADQVHRFTLQVTRTPTLTLHEPWLYPYP